MATGNQLSLAGAKAEYQQKKQGGAITKKSDKDKTIFEFLSGDPKIEKAISAVAGQYFTPDRFLRLAVNAVKKTPLLMQCDPQSVLGAFMTSAALGLEPNTVLQQAFLIPYKKRQRQGDKWVEVYECNFQIGARGFITLAHRSPQIATIQSEAIHEHDHWKHMLGSKSFLEYEKRLKERGDLIGAFCFTKMADGNEMATVLPLDELHKIRSRSETYVALARKIDEASSAADKTKAQKKLDETPWVMWQDDMAAKSATKKHAKQLPLTPGDAMQVAAQLDADDGKTIDMATMMDPDRVRAVMQEGIDAVDTGGASGEAFGTAALIHDPSPTLDAMGMTGGEAEPVERTVRNETATQQASHPVNAGQGIVEKLKHRLGTLTDADLLDAEADLIEDVATTAEEKDLLISIYKSRREELRNQSQPGQARGTAARRGGMSIE